MLPDRVSNPGPLTYESGALPIALRGPASRMNKVLIKSIFGVLYSYFWAGDSCFSENFFKIT